MEMSVLYIVGQMKIISTLRVQLVGYFQNHGLRFLGDEGKIDINICNLYNESQMEVDIFYPSNVSMFVILILQISWKGRDYNINRREGWLIWRIR